MNDYEPDRARLRDEQDTDVSSHARRNLEQLIEAAREGNIDIKDVEAYRQQARKRMGDDDE